MAKSTKTTDGASKPPAKPRKTTVKKTADVLQMEAPKRDLQDPRVTVVAPRSTSTTATSISHAPKSVSHQQVAELAHRLWDERGRVHGHDADDWFRAEKLLHGKDSEEQLRGKAS